MTWSTQKNLKEYLPKCLTVMANAHIRQLATGTDFHAITLGFKVNRLLESPDGKKRNKPLCFYIPTIGYDLAWARAVLKHRELYGETEGVTPDNPPPKPLIESLLIQKAASNGIELDRVKVASMLR